MKDSTMKVVFRPLNKAVDAKPGMKLLALARRERIPMQFGCAACSCGTCAVRILSGTASPMESSERDLLVRMGLDIGGQIRLACQARLTDEDLEVDLEFQNQYSPDTGLDHLE